MGRYNKRIGKQIKLAGVVGATILSVGALGTDVLAAEELVSDILMAPVESVVATVVAEEVPYYNVKGYGWKKTGNDLGY